LSLAQSLASNFGAEKLDCRLAPDWDRIATDRWFVVSGPWHHYAVYHAKEPENAQKGNEVQRDRPDFGRRRMSGTCAIAYLATLDMAVLISANYL